MQGAQIELKGGSYVSLAKFTGKLARVMLSEGSTYFDVRLMMDKIIEELRGKGVWSYQ